MKMNPGRARTKKAGADTKRAEYLLRKNNLIKTPVAAAAKSEVQFKSGVLSRIKNGRGPVKHVVPSTGRGIAVLCGMGTAEFDAMVKPLPVPVQQELVAARTKGAAGATLAMATSRSRSIGAITSRAAWRCTKSASTASWVRRLSASSSCLRRCSSSSSSADL